MRTTTGTTSTSTSTTGAGGVHGQSGQGSSLLGSVSGSGGLLGASTSGPDSSPLSQVTQATSQAQQALPAAAAPLTGPLEGACNEPTPDSLRIIPDPQNNALLIYGTGQETDTINAMLHKIDILPLQVRIDAVIAEVQLNDSLQYGTQFFFQSGGLNGILNFASQSNVQTPSQAQLNLSFPGFSIGGHGSGTAPFAINALQQVTTVRVLSSPQLMVLDSQPARLQVGSVVPYLSQSSQSTVSNSQVINSINYQQTGVVLDVTPRVNSGGLVTLDISQARSHLAMATEGGSLMPGTWDGDDGGGYRWHIHVTSLAEAASHPVAGPAIPLALYAVSVAISWSEGGQTREVRLDTEQIGQPVGR